MVSEEEILAAFDLYLTEENLELYDLNIANYPAISRVEVFIVSDYEIDVDLTSRLNNCLLYTSPSPRDYGTSRMPSSA